MSCCILLYFLLFINKVPRPRIRQRRRIPPCDPLAPLTPSDFPPLPRPLPLPAGRAAYITVITADHFHDFLKNWPSQERHLFQPWDSHLILVVPEGNEAPIAVAIARTLRWKRLASLTAAQRTFPCEGAVDSMEEAALSGWYRTPRAVTVAVIVRRFRLPLHLQNATYAQLAPPCGPLRCCVPGSAPLRQYEVAMLKTWALINTAFVHHALVDMGLLDAYDYLFKLDADIKMHRTPPFSPADYMRARGCAFLHTRHLEVPRENAHCWQSLVNATFRFAALHGMQPRSSARGWCRDPRLYLYGNFLGFWRPFVRAPAQRALSRWLYDNDPKYFNYADQGAVLAYLCMWYEVAELDELQVNASADSVVCSLSAWRGDQGYGLPSEKVFSHAGELYNDIGQEPDRNSEFENL